MSDKQQQKAVALRYQNDRDQAPKVVATGQGLVAETIKKKAEMNHVPTVEDESLVELLSELTINETIPEELYQAVAEVFAYIYRIDKSMTPPKS